MVFTLMGRKKMLYRFVQIHLGTNLLLKNCDQIEDFRACMEIIVYISSCIYLYSTTSINKSNYIIRQSLEFNTLFL